MSKPLASLSLDLDNKWSYLKTHGDPGWETFPSYLDVLVPRVLDILERLGLRITFFIVGQDAALEKNRPALAAIRVAGHEIANHSFAHEPWLHTYPAAKLQAEIEAAEEAIVAATGSRPLGFRGPGFSWSIELLRVLAQRGYRYDASTFPTFLGPVAKAYYFMTARLTAEEREKRRQLFGGFREGFRPHRPYQWNGDANGLLEIPVTTMPLLRAPFHLSYLLYLRQFSKWTAVAYLRSALAACRLRRIEPSILLHPLDFLGADDEPDLGFFPAMRMSGQAKIEFVTDALKLIAARHRVIGMAEHAAEIVRRGV
jgi:peptidoglycan/xylan/chitin deacetylase (PgdA/CDA1 family)